MTTILVMFFLINTVMISVVASKYSESTFNLSPYLYLPGGDKWFINKNAFCYHADNMRIFTYKTFDYYLW